VLAQAGGTVAEETKISVVTDQAVSSKTAKLARRDRTVSRDVTSAQVVIPKGSEVKLTVSGVQAWAAFHTAKLYLRLRHGDRQRQDAHVCHELAGRTEGEKANGCRVHRWRRGWRAVIGALAAAGKGAANWKGGGCWSRDRCAAATGKKI